MSTVTASPQIVSLGKERKVRLLEIKVDGQKTSIPAVIVEGCVIASGGRERRARLAQIALEPVEFLGLNYVESPLRRQITNRQILNGPGLAFAEPQQNAFNNRGLYIRL